MNFISFIVFLHRSRCILLQLLVSNSHQLQFKLKSCGFHNYLHFFLKFYYINLIYQEKTIFFGCPQNQVRMIRLGYDRCGNGSFVRHLNKMYQIVKRTPQKTITGVSFLAVRKSRVSLVCLIRKLCHHSFYVYPCCVLL